METGSIYRTKLLNEISENDIGSTIKIAGWVENIRDHGGVSFIDLRDMMRCYGGSYERYLASFGNQ